MRAPFFSLVFFFLTGFSSLLAQKPNDALWMEVDARQLPLSEERRIIPDKYRSLELDFEGMKTLLAEAPPRFGESPKPSSVLMPIPLPNGETLHVEVYDAPVLHPDLAAKYPGIRSFVGQGVEDPAAIVRFDYTLKGFHAMVLSPVFGTIFIDPYAEGDTRYYISYYKRDFKKSDDFTCHVEEWKQNLHQTHPAEQKMAGDCQLRTYRLALACTGEYAQYHGGTVADALSAMNTSMTRVNGVFERDAAITMQLVPNNDQIVFLDPATDPYTNNDGGAMLSQNQTTCDNLIGSANYDIGHVFSTGGGGVAFLESPCNSANKAKGVTGLANPVGDPFDIDYVAHEMGHQYGGRHTQNNDCNRDNQSSYEPGSASTIMGYAGVCSPDIQVHSDDYYHINSIILMGNFVTTAGNSCPMVTTTGNNPPTANAGSDYTIPRSTPFVLSGTGSDPDNDALTYCWEQYDKQVAPMPPQSTQTVGPAFRSLGPKNTPERYMPNLEAVIQGTSPTWEVLSEVNRSYHFRLTVRDNYAGAGCTADDEMVVTVDASAGPFVVTVPNTAVTWTAGTMETVSWNVAGTHTGAVNTPNVDILLSLDGGYTYPVVLASGVPNDGSETVVVPNMPTNTARVQVRGAGNIFYDISDEDFTIVGGSEADFTISLLNPQMTVCQGVNASYLVALGVVGNFSDSVALSVNGLPAGTNASFSANPALPPDTLTLTVENPASVPPGTYPFEVVGSTPGTMHVVSGVLIVQAEAPAQVVLLSPPDGTLNMPLSPLLSWATENGATSYYLEVATDSVFTTLAESAMPADTFYVAGPLAPNTTYFWHVAAQNTCGEGDFSTVFSFTTQDTFPPTDCVPPINAMAQPTANTALISWPPVPGALKYNIRYRLMGSTDPWKQKGTFTAHITLVGLSANTAYEYQLRSRCADGLTDWSELFFFTTLGGMDSPDCQAFVPIEPVSTTMNSALISWQPIPNAFLYRLRYRPLGGGEADWVRITTQDTAALLENLSPATTYEYQTKTLCAFGWTPWSAMVYQFTTLNGLLYSEHPDVHQGTAWALPFGKMKTVEDFTFFPNPATDRLVVQWPSSLSGQLSLSIRSLSGTLLYAGTFTETREVEIDLSSWPAGVYVLEWYRAGQPPLMKRFIRME